MIKDGKMQTTKYERIACPIYDNPYITKARDDARLYSFSAFCKRCNERQY